MFKSMASGGQLLDLNILHFFPFPVLLPLPAASFLQKCPFTSSLSFLLLSFHLCPLFFFLFFFLLDIVVLSLPTSISERYSQSLLFKDHNLLNVNKIAKYTQFQVFH